MFNNFTLHSCLTMARDKLHNSNTSGSREDVRLCRWVLLKNSISSAMSRAIPERAPSPPRHTPLYLNHTPAPPDDAELFVFPDGDIFAESFVSNDDTNDYQDEDDSVDTTSEAQWLDTLLESLADDDDPNFEQEPDDELIALTHLTARTVDVSTPQVAPESVFLPPSPLLSPTQPNMYRYHSPELLACEAPSLMQEIENLSLLDAVEDSASDTDSESLNTPDTRSMSSLNEPSAAPPLVRIVDEAVHHPSLFSYPFYPLPAFSNDEFGQEC